jgi:hypothetical protein
VNMESMTHPKFTVHDIFPFWQKQLILTGSAPQATSLICQDKCFINDFSTNICVDQLDEILSIIYHDIHVHKLGTCQRMCLNKELAHMSE